MQIAIEVSRGDLHATEIRVRRDFFFLKLCAERVYVYCAYFNYNIILSMFSLCSEKFLFTIMFTIKMKIRWLNKKKKKVPK